MEKKIAPELKKRIKEKERLFERIGGLEREKYKKVSLLELEKKGLY